MGKQHPPGFLKIVNEAKRHIEECTVQDVKSRLDRGETFPVENVGRAGVIQGWNEGLQGMKEGGRRVLVIPPALGYGERGFPPVIPANSTLIFMIDAVKVR